MFFNVNSVYLHKICNKDIILPKKENLFLYIIKRYFKQNQKLNNKKLKKCFVIQNKKITFLIGLNENKIKINKIVYLIKRNYIDLK